MMKQRLLLLMCVFATALCAKAYTVTFDVKFGSFMTEKEILEITFYGDSGDYYAEYDESTGKYIIHDVEAGKYNLSARYPNMKDLHKGNYQIEINSDMTIPLDFTVYHIASFKAPDGYSLKDAMVYYDNEDGGSTGSGFSNNQFYLPNGTYEWKANIVSTDGMAFLSAYKQTFTIEGADKDITYSINPNDYHKVTISVIGNNGQPVTSFNGNLYDNDNENLYYAFNSDTNGKVTVMMNNGGYKYKINSSEYSEKRGSFKVADNDVSLTVSYENYKKLKVNVTGSMLDEFNSLSLYMSNKVNYDGGHSYSLNKVSDTEYITEGYLEPTIFDYTISFNIKDNKSMMPQFGEIDLSKTDVLNIDMSAYPVTFNTVNENNEPINGTWIDIITENGYRYEVSNKTLYMQPGDYTAKVNIEVDRQSERVAHIYKDFTVGTSPQEIKTVYDKSQYSEVTVNLQNVSDAVKPYADLYIKLFSGNRVYADEVIEDGLFVPKGTYNYVVSGNKSGIVPLTGTVTVTGENDHIDLDFSQYGVVLVKLQDAQGTQADIDDYEFFIKQDNKLTSAWQEYDDIDYAVLLEPAGTYTLFVTSIELGSAEKSITIDAGTVKNETVTLATRQPGTFSVCFEIEDITYNSNDEFEYKVSLQGYGELLLTNGYGGFTNVAAADGLAYTVSAPGYQTLTGTIDVNEENSNNGFIGLYLRIRADNSTAIETVKANNSFRVYPTVADDYINIRTNEQDNAATWTIRLTSATGATVYMDKLVLDGEEQIYVGNLPKGFYLLTLNNGEQRMTYKILKK